MSEKEAETAGVDIESDDKLFEIISFIERFNGIFHFYDLGVIGFTLYLKSNVDENW